MAIVVTGYTKAFSLETGQSANIVVEATADSAITFLWEVGGIMVQSGSSPTYRYTAPETDGDYTVSCTITESGNPTPAVINFPVTVETKQAYSPALNIPKIEGMDIQFSNADFAEEETFTTAIILALFTDGIADSSDTLPTSYDTDRRGWWGDEILDLQTGSTAWVYADRGKLTKDTLISVRSAYENALLRHFVDTDMADSILVEYKQVDYDTVAWNIEIRVNADSTAYLTWTDRWNASLTQEQLR